MTDKITDKQKVFISYSRLDSLVVTELIEDLERTNIVRVFRDTEDILPTEKWKARLEQLMEQADTIIFALSPRSAVSEVCRWEVEYAEGLNKRIAPVVIEAVDPAEIPPTLTKYNYIFFTPEHNREAALRNLHIALTANIDWIREHTRIGEVALRWERSGYSNAIILRGSALLEAENWLAQQPSETPIPTSLQLKYVASSRKAASRRQKLWIFSALAVALISGGLAILSEVNRQAAVEERLRVERVLERTTSATKELVIEIANRYSTRKNVPRALTTAVLQQARRLVAELDTVGEAGSTLQMNGALALAELSDALRNNGEREAALSTASSSVQLFQQLHDKNPAWEPAQAGLFLALDRQGDILWDSARYEEAEEAWRTAATFVDQLPASQTKDLYKAITLENIGSALAQANDHEGALEKFHSALELRRGSFLITNSLQARRDEAAVLENVANAHLALSQPVSALSALKESLDLAKSVASEDNYNTGFLEDLATAHMSLADFYLSTRQLDGATSQLNAYQTIVSELHASDPPWRVWRQMLMVGHERLASLYYLRDNFVDAQRFFKLAYIQASALAKQDPSQRDWLANVSKLAQSVTLMMLHDGQPQAALEQAMSAIEVVRAAKMAGADAIDYEAELLNNAAWYSLFTGTPDVALRYANEALNLYPDKLLYIPNRAHALALLGEPDNAWNLYLRYRGRTLDDGRQWEDVVISDFETMSAAGLVIPERKKIETALNSQ